MKWESIDKYPEKDDDYYCKGTAPGDCPVKFIASFTKKDKWGFFYPDHSIAFPFPFINVMWLKERTK